MCRRVCTGAMHRAVVAMALLLSLLAVVQGQSRRSQQQTTPDNNQSQIAAKKPSVRGPRAIGVLEFLSGGGTRLVPVALWIDGHFYDASLYGANPEPMAVEPETVYEATDYGEPTGLFTVTTPIDVKGNWVGDGRWKPHMAMDEKMAQQAAKQPKAKRNTNPDDDRPVLRRPGASDSDHSAGQSSSTPTRGPGDNTPADSSARATQPPNSPADTDSNRPTLKKPAESAPAPVPVPVGQASQATRAGNATKPSSPPPDDGSRPVLRRGKPPAEEQQLPDASSSGAAAGSPAAKATSATGPVVHRSYPAVSDAGAYETRSLLYSMNAEERAAKADQMRALALQEIRDFIAKRHTSAVPAAANISAFDFRAYDLDYSNSPTLVLSAALPVAGGKPFRGGEFDYFVTVVAREDINGNAVKIFSLVSDSNHLDAFPRMEIIDAVDADANGRGDLLFRQHSDTGISYSLYRVFPYDMQKVFEGGSNL